jgi:hypothetical protein
LLASFCSVLAEPSSTLFLPTSFARISTLLDDMVSRVKVDTARFLWIMPQLGFLRLQGDHQEERAPWHHARNLLQRLPTCCCETKVFIVPGYSNPQSG